MSRVHDALRRASQDRSAPSRQSRTERIQPRVEEPVAATKIEAPSYPAAPSHPAAPPAPPPAPAAASLPLHLGSDVEITREDLEAVIHAAHQIPYNPQKD